MEVFLGTNRFVDCETIVRIRGEPTLKVAAKPLRLTIVTPQELPSGRVVRVIDNASEPNPGTGEASSHVRVVHGDKNVTVFWDHFLLAVATELAPDSIHLHVDLRPVGLLVFDDANGLHVGTMHFASSTVQGAGTVFMLG